MEDIQDEGDSWSSSLICYVVGANPPIQVMEGYLRRVWKNFNVDKVAVVKKGMFLVRFKAMESRDRVMEGHYFFVRKPVILKPWHSDMDFERETLKTIPVLVQLKLDLKYWGEKSLHKIAAQLGDPIKRDEATRNREKLQN